MHATSQSVRFLAVFVTTAFLAGPCLAGVQCISGSSSMQQAILNEASRTTGVSEFRLRAMTFTQAFEFIPSVVANNRTIIVDGGWNSGCSSKVAGARSVLPSVALRDVFPNTTSTSDVTVSNVEVAAPLRLDLGTGAVLIQDNRIALPDTSVMNSDGSPLTLQRNQIFGGELYISASAGSAALKVSNNELRDLRRLRMESHSTGAIEIRNNTVLLRNDHSTTIQFGVNTFDLYVYGDAASADISNNLIGRSTAFDVWPNAATSVYLLTDADANSRAPALTFAGNWIQAAGQGVTHGSDEFEAEWIDPTNRNVEMRTALPFNAAPSTPFLTPATNWGGVNAGWTIAGDSAAVDLRARPRLVGVRTDVGAHETDVLAASSFEE